MTHEGGATKPVRLLSIIGKDAHCRVDGVGGVYVFKLLNGECKHADNWFLEGDSLEYVRAKAAEAEVKFNTSPRVRLRDKGRRRRARKTKAPKACVRTVDMFSE